MNAFGLIKPSASSLPMTAASRTASCEASESSGLSVTTRKTVVETIENTRDKGVAVSVYIGKRRGHSSTSDFAGRALREAVQAAYDIARFTAEDDCAGLPDQDTLETAPAELDLFHPWAIETDEAIRISGASTAGSTLPTEPQVCCRNIATTAISIRVKWRGSCGRTRSNP